ncbi:hypothetical protein F4803DRAFT_511718 [Xylaria telfairii]|nr:hypothetical protein F4803DRAFT_511718 [Xylaria telfairii]
MPEAVMLTLALILPQHLSHLLFPTYGQHSFLSSGLVRRLEPVRTLSRLVRTSHESTSVGQTHGRQTLLCGQCMHA